MKNPPVSNGGWKPDNLQGRHWLAVGDTTVDEGPIEKWRDRISDLDLCVCVGFCQKSAVPFDVQLAFAS